MILQIKKILAVVIILTITPFVSIANNSLERVLHVSSFGSDSNDGSLKRPLATLEGARQYIRKLKKDTPIRVIFHEGEYRFRSGVKFDESDSGNDYAPIIYQAAEGENVIFKGSRKLDASKFQPVTGSDILARLPNEAHEKAGQLNLREQGIESIPPFVPNMQNEAIGGEQISFYLNGTKQPVSQWPNGEGNYASWVKILSSGTATFNTNTGTGAVIQYEEANPSRWVNATDFYIGGYPGYDYRYERISGSHADPENKTVTMAYGSNYGFINDEGKRWKAFNLLEEIDSPGEWYVDRETMMLYYYPSYTLLNAEFEMADLREDFITMTGTQYITIKGIHFTQTCANAIVLKTKADHITIEGCSFSDIGQKAVFAYGSVRGSVENSNQNNIDGVTNCIIRDNDFYYIGSAAVDLTGGNRDTLKRGENHIENNHIYHAAIITKNTPNISIYGVGNFVEHNLIHNSPFHAINFSGNDHKVRYNELYNVGREAFDAGVIYSGRSLIRRGTEVSYNFVHDYLRTDEKIGYDVLGIFLDDCQSGISIHHNMFVNGAAGIQVGGGHDNSVYSNTVLNMKGNIINSDNRGEAWDREFGLDDPLKQSLEIPAYVEKYPELLKTAKDTKPPHRNSILDNLSDKAVKINARMEELGNVSNNISVLDLSDFVNPEKQDYRIKSGSEISKKIPDILTDEFDITKIGLQKSENRSEVFQIDKEKASFRKLYPQNGASGIDAKNCMLKWENSLYADKYKVIIASDPEMKDIVHTQETNFNFVNITELEKGLKPYYWTVEAQNTSRQQGDSWSVSGVPFVFTTTLYDVLDKTELSKSIKEHELFLEAIIEGDEPGEYKEGSRQRFSDAFEYAKEVYSLKHGQVTQNQLDDAAQGLKNEKIITMGSINKGYAGIENMLESSDDWIAPSNTVSLINEEIIFKSEADLQAHYNKFPDSYETLCFDAKIDFPDSPTWTGFMLRQQSTEKKIWSTSGYLITIKPDIFELQRFPGGIIATASNNIIKSGEWHEIQYGALDTEKGVHVTFKIDGKKIFDYTDSEAPVRQNGSFGIYAAKNHTITLKNAGFIPAEEEGIIYAEPELLNISELFNNNDLWNTSGGNISWNNDGLYFITEADTAVLSYESALEGNKILDFDASFNPKDKWQAVGLRTAEISQKPWSTDNYLVVIKENSLELQRFKNGKNEILAICDNLYIKDGEKVNIKYGAFETENGIRLVFFADGNKIFDYMDTNPVTEAGKLAFYDMSGGGIGLYSGNNSETGDFEPVEIKSDGTVYNAGGSGYISSGSWVDGSLGFNGLTLKASDDPDASARWSFSMQPGIYKVYYWSCLSVNGDENANLEIFASGEDDTRNLKINFERGTSGWKDMGVYFPSDGVMTITLTGSGQGEILASALRLVKSNSSEQALSHLFEKAERALIFKTDSQKAFLDREIIKIPDTAPVTVNERTLVPVRFISEALNGFVKWDNEAQRAVVEAGGNVMSFVNGDQEYTLNGELKTLEQGAVIINGRMMLPLRALAEGMGKEVYADESGLIIIADKIMISAKNDADILKVALDALSN